MEAAAVEAGISPEFVRLALEESEQGESPTELPRWQERTATRLLGSARHTLEVSRSIAAPAAAVWEAMQRVLPAHPYSLTLRSALGDPLEGGPFVMDVPSIYGTTYTPLTYWMFGIGVKKLRFALRPSETEGRCELTVSADLRSGRRTNGWTSAGLTSMCTGGGAVAGAVVGTVALGGALLALPAVAGAGALGGGMASGYRALYRWSLRRGRATLEQLVDVVDVSSRTSGAFAPPLPPANTGASLAVWMPNPGG